MIRIIEKFYRAVLAKVRWLFFHTNNILIFRRLGIRLYKVGLFVAVRQFSKMPEVVAIYSLTKFDDKFIVGESDIDLYIVFKDLNFEEQFFFMKRLSALINRLTRVIIFLDINYMSKNTLRQHQVDKKFEIIKQGRRVECWQLLYGSDIRREEYEKIDYSQSEIDPLHLRGEFERALLNLYEVTLLNGTYFRRFYHCFFGMLHMIFVHQHKRESISVDEYRDFLLDHGFSENFLNSLFALPENKFKGSRELACQMAFYLLKMTELTKPEKVDHTLDFEVKNITNRESGSAPSAIKDFSKNIASIQLKSIYFFDLPFRRGSYLYLIIKPDTNYDQFKKLFNNILDNLYLLKDYWGEKEWSTKHKEFCEPGFFPLIVTEQLLNNPNFITPKGIYETAKFNTSGIKLFGEDVLIDTKKVFTKLAILRPTHAYPPHTIELPTFAEQGINLKEFKKHHPIPIEWQFAMAFRLLLEKQQVWLSDFEEEYYKQFGDIAINTFSIQDKYFFALVSGVDWPEKITS